MKRAILILALATAAMAALLDAAPASAGFGLKDIDVTFTDSGGDPSMQAGSHPFAMTTSFAFNTKEDPGKGFQVTDGAVKDLDVEMPAGFTGNPTAVPRCETLDFLTRDKKSGGHPHCADSTAVGTLTVVLGGGTGSAGEETVAFYNMAPAPGAAAKLGFEVGGVPLTLDVGVSSEPPYNVIASLSNTSQLVEALSSNAILWGNPADPAHDSERGLCIYYNVAADNCPANVPPNPFLTLPRSCTGPLLTLFKATSWWSGDPLNPGPSESFEEGVESHDDSEPPGPLGMTGCSRLGFGPAISAQPTTKAASSPTGLDFGLDIADEGLTSAEGLADTDIEKAVVTLPEGMSVNPSQAEGLGVCTVGQLDAETAFSAPGAGCPNASKIGTIEVETPILENRVLKGSLFIAKPYENEFGSLIALYIVIKDPTLGIVVKQAAKVTPDPVTGQLVTTSEDMPQLPFSHFRLHFREGTRSPLASPPGCGAYNAEAELTPWSGEAPITTTSTFQIITGPDGGPCPSGGLPPFKPGLIAGTLNNAAGRFSPFNVRLFRSDSEQEITNFSIKLPPGIVGKLAGIPFCPDAAIAAAKARTGPLGGHEELASPSCPAASEIGHSLAGAGVGPALAYVPGKVYLAGPYHGSALSIVAVTSGVAGPFDLGTVVIREALKIDPETAEVFIDPTGSDPIPHIIQGIPVHLRDIRAYVDRPEFVLNPSGCERTSTASTLLGSGLDFGSEADDNPVTVSTPFQAADCAALPFKPKLSLRLIGGTRRGAHPKLMATLRMGGFGEAGIAKAQVTLPKSEFIENAHFKTICTRVQFKAGAGNGAQCPAGSIYGYATANTPILDEPLRGPVFLRSSEHQLPDVVAAFHSGKIDVDLVGRVDSVKGGGIRNTFETVPDAPVTSATFTFQGASKGLFVNSTNLCKGKHRAEVNFTGHNGKVYNTKPALLVKCPKDNKKKKRAKRRAAR